MKKLTSLFALLITSCHSPPTAVDLPGATCELIRHSVVPAYYFGKAVEQGTYLCSSGGSTQVFLSRGRIMGVASGDPDIFTAYLDYSMSCKNLPEILSGSAYQPGSVYVSSYFCGERNSFLVLASSSSTLYAEEFWQPALSKGD